MEYKNQRLKGKNANSSKQASTLKNDPNPNFQGSMRGSQQDSVSNNKNAILPKLAQNKASNSYRAKSNNKLASLTTSTNPLYSYEGLQITSKEFQIKKENFKASTQIAKDSLPKPLTKYLDKQNNNLDKKKFNCFLCKNPEENGEKACKYHFFCFKCLSSKEFSTKLPKCSECKLTKPFHQVKYYSSIQVLENFEEKKEKKPEIFKRNLNLEENKKEEPQLIKSFRSIIEEKKEDPQNLKKTLETVKENKGYPQYLQDSLKEIKQDTQVLKKTHQIVEENKEKLPHIKISHKQKKQEPHFIKNNLKIEKLENSQTNDLHKENLNLKQLSSINDSTNKKYMDSNTLQINDANVSITKVIKKETLNEPISKLNENNCFICNKRIIKDKIKNYICKKHSFCPSCISSEQIKERDCLQCLQFLNNETKKKYMKSDELIKHDPEPTHHYILPSPSVIDTVDQQVVASSMTKDSNVKVSFNSMIKPQNSSDEVFFSIAENQEDKKSDTSEINLATIETKCSNCDSLNEIKGFLCNHNLCIECLTLECCKKIELFYYNYSEEKNIIFRNFFYSCPIQGCLADISVPTALISINLNKFLQENNGKFVRFSYLQDKIPLWIPFLDGLSHLIYYI